jgi:hypothetical protein
MAIHYIDSTIMNLYFNCNDIAINLNSETGQNPNISYGHSFMVEQTTDAGDSKSSTTPNTGKDKPVNVDPSQREPVQQTLVNRIDLGGHRELSNGAIMSAALGGGLKLAAKSPSLLGKAATVLSSLGAVAAAIVIKDKTSGLSNTLSPSSSSSSSSSFIDPNS